MDRARFSEIIGAYPNVRCLVVGDFCLDGYWDADQSLSEPSVETAFSTIAVVGQRYSPGGAGNVAWNLADLDAAEVRALGVVGSDPFGAQLKVELEHRGVDVSHLIVGAGRNTACYMKPLLRYGNVVNEGNRMDFTSTGPIEGDLERRVIEYIEQCVEDVDAVIVNDQRADRVVTEKVGKELMALAERYPDKVFLVDARERVGGYRCMVLKPNETELMKTLGLDIDPAEDALHYVRRHGPELQRMNGGPVYVTVGPDGVVLFYDGKGAHVPTAKLEGEIDTVGAGDTFIAALALSLSSGATHEEAASIANMATAVTVRKLHQTGTATPDKLQEAYELFRQQRVFERIERF